VARADLINGRNYVALTTWARSNGFWGFTLNNGAEFVLTNKTSRLVFEQDSTDSTINGVNVRLSFPVAKGGFIDDAKRQQIAAKMSRYSGLSEKSILQHNLSVPTDFFWKELLREKNFTVGRLDSRYLGLDKMQAGESPDYNSELTSWLHAFTPAINYYLRDVLKYKTDIKYNMFGPVHPWDNKDDRTGENLRQAMAENPYMHLMIQSGYFDGATTYFDAKYTMWQIDPSGKLKDRMRFEGYRSGHMMYLRAQDLATSNEHIREFIKKSTPASGQPAKY